MVLFIHMRDSVNVDVQPHCGVRGIGLGESKSRTYILIYALTSSLMVLYMIKIIKLVHDALRILLPNSDNYKTSAW